MQENHLPSLTRRRFLKAALPTSVMLATGGVMGHDLWRSWGHPRPPATKPWQIAVIGAGIAGLTAAHTLARKGLDVTVYEASARIGGRILSAKGSVASGATAEWGGEFISSHHKDIQHLAQLFHLPLLDRQHDSKSHLHPYAFVAEGKRRTEKEMTQAFKPVASRIKADATLWEEELKGSATFEQQSLASYLQNIPMQTWLRKLLTSAYTCEFGCELEHVAALSLLHKEPTIEDSQVHLFGEADKRYQIAGGNQKLIEALAHNIQAHIRTNSPLLAVKEKGKKYHLFFKGHERAVDAVIVTAPFSTVRKMKLSLDLSDSLRRLIRELRYGTHSKCLVGFTNRLWQRKGFLGEFVADTGFQQAWEHSLFQSTAEAGLTFQTGGQTGLAWQKTKTTRQQLLAPFHSWLPALAQQANGKMAQMSWSHQPWSRGSISCLGPGQYAPIVKPNLYHEGSKTTVGTDFFLFAGEHLSAEYPGTMNGAAQTGRLAAESLIRGLT